MKNLEYKNYEIKSVQEPNEGEMYIEGYGAVFGNIDSYKDIIEKGAFKKSISENKERIAFCYQHDIYEPIGKIEEIKEDEYGLWLKVRISDTADDVKTMIREGILKEMSVGFQTVKSTIDEQTYIRTITEVKLWEVSIVTIAANPLALIGSVKSIEEKNTILEQEFDKIIAIEQNREKKYNLLKLKSLVFALPVEPQRESEPITQKNGFDFDKITFVN
jgi:HK97 family phage prohead protease